MTCPKCNEGTLEQIKFKKSGEIAYLCPLCETVWLATDEVTETTGRALASFAHPEDREYAVEQLPGEDTEHALLAKDEDTV